MRKTTTLGLTAALILFSTVLTSCLSPDVKQTRAMEIEHINLASVHDGTYTGSYSYGKFTYRVEVSVSNHRIEQILIKNNRVTSHARKAEGVIPEILELQRNDVDAVSGATSTSKALLKAVENALRKGTEQS